MLYAYPIKSNNSETGEFAQISGYELGVESRLDIDDSSNWIDQIPNEWKDCNWALVREDDDGEEVIEVFTL